MRKLESKLAQAYAGIELAKRRDIRDVQTVVWWVTEPIPDTGTFKPLLDTLNEGVAEGLIEIRHVPNL